MATVDELLAQPANQRKDQRSDLMKAKARSIDGSVVNACPFGCGTEDLDEHGYCDHLIGFSVDGKTYEPMVMDTNGRRVVIVPKEQVGTRRTPRGKEVPIMKPVLGRVKAGDKLVRITTSSRVYRKNVDSVEEDMPDQPIKIESRDMDPEDWVDPAEPQEPEESRKSKKK